MEKDEPEAVAGCVRAQQQRMAKRLPKLEEAADADGLGARALHLLYFALLPAFYYFVFNINRAYKFYLSELLHAFYLLPEQLG